MRLFVAIDPSAEQRSELQRLQQRLDGLLDGVRWVPRASLHLTLKFLGEQEAARLEAIVEAMREAALSAGPFTLQFGGAGAFPSPQRPRIIWAGVARGEGPLGALARSLEAALTGRGFPAERRPFRAHLTLGRARRPLPERAFPGLLAAEAGFSTPPGLVRSLQLYASTLSPRGARYTALNEIFFAGDRGK